MLRMMAVWSVLLLCTHLAHAEPLEACEGAAAVPDSFLAEDRHVSLLQRAMARTGEALTEAAILEEGATRQRQPECFQVQKPPPSPLNDDPAYRSSYVYLVAATDDSKTNPTSWRYAQRRNVREWWSTGGFVVYFQESEAPDAPWASWDLRTLESDQPDVVMRYNVDYPRACPTPGSCWSVQWHVEMWEGHPLMLNWCCQMDLVGHEVFWAGGQTASPELMEHVRDLIQRQGGGLENFPIVEVPTGPYSQECPWGGGQSGMANATA
eukprot:gb/GFBE01045583.1/.p1 GENE.gb/GFBE01045583.1/~~gb/GFBE01045583.1/.p1  ORF type:complete len:266 (+),score=29.16 gb/GFBE01045583.1/:1-798(+)